MMNASAKTANTLFHYDMVCRGYAWFQSERDFDGSKALLLMQTWTPTCMGIVALYVAVVFAGPALMKTRPPLQLRTPLLLWNTGLAVFSIVGAIKGAMHIYTVISREGAYSLLCNNRFYNSTCGTWAFLFATSKVFELGDTVFLILRKRPVIFLHWYHHVSVLLFSWFAYLEHSSLSLCFAALNYAVHAVMYSYFALQSARVRVPSGVTMGITLLQLSQMVFGVWFNLMAQHYQRAGRICHVSTWVARGSLLMYSSYFVLFAHFFYNAYFSRKKSERNQLSKSGQTPEVDANVGDSKKTS